MLYEAPGRCKAAVDGQSCPGVVGVTLFPNPGFQPRLGVRGGYRSSVLNSSEKLVVFVVWSDPEPHDAALVHYSKSAIVDTYAHRVHRTPPTHPLEVEAGVIGIRRKETVRFPRLPSHVVRKVPICIPETLTRKRTHAYKSSAERGQVRPARCSARASSASRSSRTSDSGRANNSVH